MKINSVNISFLPQLSINETSVNSKINYYHSQPKSDVVSFGAKIPKYPNTFFMEALGRSYDTTESKLIAKAKEFHNALKRVSERLKAYGFSYDEEYNMANPIKKKASVLDKYERQGNVQDLIRGTVYWQDQQDVSAFGKFIEEMKKEGWEISPLRQVDATGGFVRNKKGSIIKFPDLEIRQEGITKESLAPLGEFMQRAEISKPRSSTYSDWQARFISTKEKGMREGRRGCEVIFLYGENYKNAKEIEHKYVYEPWRKLKKIHVDMDPEHHPKNSAGHTISSNVGEIHKRLVQFISQPLFTNAFNEDLKIKDFEKIPVEISKAYGNLIMNYCKLISKSISTYYSQMGKELMKDEQIANAIKESPAYQLRDDKYISSKEIKTKRSEIRKKLSDWKEKDLIIIKESIEDIKETLNKFGV